MLIKLPIKWQIYTKIPKYAFYTHIEKVAKEFVQLLSKKRHILYIHQNFTEKHIHYFVPLPCSIFHATS